MRQLYEAWQKLLGQHSHLLSDLEKGLHQERQALLAGDINLLKEASLLKDKASRQVLQIEDQINQFKLNSVQALGLTQAHSLQEIFTAFGDQWGQLLLAKRRELLRQSKKIQKLNEFNNQCLNSYLDYVGGIRSIFSMHKPELFQTYSSSGETRNNENSGRLLDRSF